MGINIGILYLKGNWFCMIPLCPKCLKKMKLLVHHQNRLVQVYCPFCDVVEKRNYKKHMKEVHQENFKPRYEKAKNQYIKDWYG